MGHLSHEVVSPVKYRLRPRRYQLYKEGRSSDEEKKSSCASRLCLFESEASTGTINNGRFVSLVSLRSCSYINKYQS